MHQTLGELLIERESQNDITPIPVAPETQGSCRKSHYLDFIITFEREKRQKAQSALFPSCGTIHPENFLRFMNGGRFVSDRAEQKLLWCQMAKPFACVFLFSVKYLMMILLWNFYFYCMNCLFSCNFLLFSAWTWSDY